MARPPRGNGLTQLTLPPLHSDVLAACRAAGWHAVTYEGAGITRGRTVTRYAGIVAIHGDLRAHIEWHTDPPVGTWQTRFAGLAVRHPGHDQADFARVHPKRSACHCPVAGDRDLLQLLRLPPAVLAGSLAAS